MQIHSEFAKNCYFQTTFLPLEYIDLKYSAFIHDVDYITFAFFLYIRSTYFKGFQRFVIRFDELISRFLIRASTSTYTETAGRVWDRNLKRTMCSLVLYKIETDHY